MNIEVIETINDIKNTIEENPADELMVIGDLNADFRRKSEQVRQVKIMIEKHSLNINDENIDYTLNTSCENIVLDHLITSKGIKVTKNKAIHVSENSSDHEPIISEIELNSNANDTVKPSTLKEANIKEPQNNARTDWRNVNDNNIDKYKVILNNKLEILRNKVNVITCDNLLQTIYC